MATRRYQQRLRAENAEATRLRILEGVYQLLRETPAEAVSLDGIARAARVSRSTVYAIFGSRAGLFDAVAADLFERAGFDRIVAAVADPDARQHLRAGITATAQLYAGIRDVGRALISMAHLDPDALGQAIKKIENNRSGGMDYLARRLAQQGLLRPGLTQDEAADLLWVLTSFDTFDLLYTGRGLSTDAVARRLVDTAERALCR